jgi:SsrA-binding protein
MKLTNKIAKFNYFLSENLEVGLVLRGPEVKSILKGGLSLKESYVKIIQDEVWLINANVSEMKFNQFDNDIDSVRPKKLLMHRKQINKFKKLLQTPGTTLIMYEVYTDDNGRLKGNLMLGKGKQNHDKRQVIKERDLERYGI